jgi:hypothetical protein
VILAFDRCIMAWHRSNETSKRLDAIPGVGPALATALVASIGDPKAFRSGGDFSAWIGLVPKQNSSGGKDKLGNISKQGDRYLRSLFTAGALAVIRYAKLHGTKHRPWPEPVDPAIGTTHLGQRIVECVLLTGTRSAEGIMASGHVNRTNRPNTWLLRRLLHA